MTHGPPHYILDTCQDGFHPGDRALKKEILERVKPKYHLFGHIHEAYGEETHGPTTFINASVCTLHYKPNQKPIVFDYKVPMIGGVTERKLKRQVAEGLDLTEFKSKLSD